MTTVVVRSYFGRDWHSLEFDKSLALLKPDKLEEKDEEDIGEDEQLRDAA